LLRVKECKEENDNVKIGLSFKRKRKTVGEQKDCFKCKGQEKKRRKLIQSVNSHTNPPVAEVILVVSSNQRHSELVSTICIKYIELFRDWRSHFIGAWT